MLGEISSSMADLLLQGHWAPRSIIGHWIRWVPRCSNSVAVALANLSMNSANNVGWQSLAWLDGKFAQSELNVVMATDGEARLNQCKASAGWAAFAFTAGQRLPSLIACGAILLEAVTCGLAN